MKTIALIDTRLELPGVSLGILVSTHPDVMAAFAANDAFQKAEGGKEPWLDGLHKVTWETFFRVCTEEMDDLSQRAIKLVIEYCLEILEGAEAKIQGKPSLAPP